MEKTGVDPKRIVALFFIGSTVFLGAFLERVLGIVFDYARVNNPAVFGESYTVATLVGYGIAIAAAIALWRTPRVQNLALEVAQELNKVTWPTMRETRAATVAVIAAAAVSAVLLGLFDYVWARLSELLY